LVAVARVIHLSEVDAVASEEGELRVLIDTASGSRRLTQVVADIHPGGESAIPGHPQEEVVYVAEGKAEVRLGSADFALGAGTGFLIPPGASGSLHNPGPGSLRMVVVVSPPLGMELPAPATASAAPTLVREAEQESLPAGEDRYFKLLIDPRLGARNVTQFVGFIARSKAPPHTHVYEEAIYILEGEGIVYADDRQSPIRPGTSIFLPPGTPHCLENRSPGTLKLLGVFSPPGSPAVMRER
jgi:quercetin dioxygenase-like cupin family protein